MNVKQPRVILELSEFESRILAFALHEYIWSRAKKFKNENPNKSWEDFEELYDPTDTESNNMIEMWSQLAKFWKQESIHDFEELIKKTVFEPEGVAP